PAMQRRSAFSSPPVETRVTGVPEARLTPRGAPERRTAGALRRCCALLLLAACAAQPSAPAGDVELPLPERSHHARSGSELAAALRDLSLDARERLVEREVLAGNVPAFRRRLEPITVAATIRGRVHTIEYFVTPDYLAVGSDTDFFRVPLTAPTAQRLADRLGCLLPTRKIVDDVHRAAAVRLEPRPFHPDSHDITSVAVFEASHAAIEAQRSGRPGLASGVKKDLVVSNAIAERPGRVVIYGWHRANGAAIQPLSNVHVAGYVDYSHGVRLVHGRVLVDGEERDLAAVLADPDLSALVSDE